MGVVTLEGEYKIFSADLTEVGVNYIIDGHNLRLNFNYTSGDANLTGLAGADVDGFIRRDHRGPWCKTRAMSTVKPRLNPNRPLTAD